MAALIDRAKNILISPKTEWEAIGAETSPHMPVITGYVLPLAAVAALAAFIGMVFVGVSGFGMTVRTPIGAGIATLILTVVMAVAMVFLLGFIIDALAPTFGGQKNFSQAVKVAAYSYTPVWVVGILAIIPALGLLGIVAAIYAVYLLYLGLPRVMKAPQDKAPGYTAVVVVVAIVLGFILAMIVGAVTAAFTPAMSYGGAGAGANVTYDKNSAAGKLDDFAKKMEEASKRMEAAQKSGDPNKQMEAAMGALGTAMSGGKGVEPVQLDALKPFVPEKFAGLPRTSQNADRSGVQGFMVAKIEAEYADQGGKRVDLEVTDTGGAAGLVGLASFMGVQGERENEERKEVTRKEGNRLVHEEVSKRGGQNKYSVVLNERFVVSAEGAGVDIGTLKSAVNGLDLGKLESLK
jgi:hypothetical protein